MFTKHLMTAFFLTVGVGLTGCAAETSDAKDNTDAVALGDDAPADGNVEIALAESRACTSSELGIAQAHADENHSSFGYGHVKPPVLTSCNVQNGWIVYTYM